jgi:hypothetical protein
MNTPETKLNPGDTMKDGTIFAGISPDTGKPMYTTPTDAPLSEFFNNTVRTYDFKDARTYANTLDAHSHQDWRIPTKEELNVLFNNRAAIGNFNLRSSQPSGLYWSSSRGPLGLGIEIKCFGDGQQTSLWKSCGYAYLRCVR